MTTRRRAANRVALEYRDIHTLTDYSRNPRDNTKAVAAVANSIRQFGFLVPVVVDGDNVIVAGHTRVAAAKTLNMDEVPVIVASHLTETQLAAFRLVDNKVSELASWDFDLLAGELSTLSESGLLMTDFGWTQEELSCFGALVSSDCLSTDTLVDENARNRINNLQRRAPATARYVLGELTFFTSASDYRRWVDGIRALHDYDETAIIADIKQRLGIVEATVEATSRVRRTRQATPAT